jgi:hypothetical protein
MDDDEEEGGISFVTDAAPPSLAADDSFDAPVVSGATPAADEKPRGKAPKGSNGQQLMWDPVLGTYIEGAYEAEAKELCSALLRKDPSERLTIEQVSASVMATDDH